MQAIAKVWERELYAMLERLGHLFRRPEPRQRSLAYMKGLLGTVERKNGCLGVFQRDRRRILALQYELGKSKGDKKEDCESWVTIR